jgi:hypothetical protein
MFRAVALRPGWYRISDPRMVSFVSGDVGGGHCPGLRGGGPWPGLSVFVAIGVCCRCVMTGSTHDQ